MPIYEFFCEDCEATFDHLTLSHDEHINLVCYNCGSTSLHKIISTCNTSIKHKIIKTNKTSQISNRSCVDGTCSTITLRGHSR